MKHMYIQVSEDEFTAIKQYGIWELEQVMREKLLNALAEKEHSHDRTNNSRKEN